MSRRRTSATLSIPTASRATSRSRRSTLMTVPARVFADGAGESSGFAALTRDPGDREEAVMGVWLLRAARRKGIGRELALMATDFARAAGYQKLRGTLPEGNEPALSFFSDIGSLAQVVGQGMEYELPL